MNYFQILGVVFGIVAFLKPFYMHILPWDENKYIAKAYSKKRPSWVIPVAIAGLALVGFTWYKEFSTDIKYSLIISILFSLTAIKAVVLIFDYEKFHRWVAGMLQKDRGRQVVMVDIFAGVFGLVLIVLSIILF